MMSDYPSEKEEKLIFYECNLIMMIIYDNGRASDADLKKVLIKQLRMCWSGVLVLVYTRKPILTENSRNLASFG